MSTDSKNFFYNLGRAFYNVDSYYREFARQNGISLTLLCVLYALNDGRLHTQIEISADWALPKTTVNTVIKDIQQSGFIELIPVKGKKREMYIILTESGKQYADNLLSDIYKKEAEVYKQLCKEDREIVALVEKIARKLKEDIE